MNAGPVALVGILAAFSGGCHYARGVGFADSLPPGRPSFAAGMPEGYWIWEDRQGWHLRTTSDVPHHFHGDVEVMGGTLGALRPVGAAAGGVRSEGGAITFDYQSGGGEHGFDWGSSSACGRFELYIDGTPRPLRVFLGGVERSPPRVPFAVCR